MEMIDQHQAMALRAHLMVMKSRFSSLRSELESAVIEGQDTQKDLESLHNKWNSLLVEFSRRREDIELDFDDKIQEIKKQIKLSEGMLEKKKEERRAILDYIHEAHISEKIPDDLRNFDWDSLHKMVLGVKKSDHLDKQKQKMQILSDLVKKGSSELDKLLNLLPSTIDDKNRLNSKMNEFRCYVRDWQETCEIQGKRLEKMKNENERLNLLIKQCAFGNEPVSDYVTKSVRAKCHSFLSSGSSEEQLQGLIKFRSRQDRLIKLLKHQDNRLGQEISRLQIASDQTSDLMMYYSNILDAQKASSLLLHNQMKDQTLRLANKHTGFT